MKGLEASCFEDVSLSFHDGFIHGADLHVERNRFMVPVKSRPSFKDSTEQFAAPGDELIVRFVLNSEAQLRLRAFVLLLRRRVDL